MGMSKVFRSHHIWMRVDPQYTEISAITRIQVGNGCEIHKAITSEGNDAVRVVFLNNLPGEARLLNDCRPAHDAILDNERLARFRFRHWNRLNRAFPRRCKPCRQLRPKIVAVLVSALPLRHVQPHSCSD